MRLFQKNVHLIFFHCAIEKLRLFTNCTLATLIFGLCLSLVVRPAYVALACGCNCDFNHCGRYVVSDPDGCPVDLIFGHKMEMAVDIVVPLPGQDYSLARTYRSSAVGNGDNLNAGNYWRTSIFQTVEVVHDGISGDQTPQIGDRRLALITHDGVKYFYKKPNDAIAVSADSGVYSYMQFGVLEDVELLDPTFSPVPPNPIRDLRVVMHVVPGETVDYYCAPYRYNGEGVQGSMDEEDDLDDWDGFDWADYPYAFVALHEGEMAGRIIRSVDLRTGVIADYRYSATSFTPLPAGFSQPLYDQTCDSGTLDPNYSTHPRNALSSIVFSQGDVVSFTSMTLGTPLARLDFAWAEVLLSGLLMKSTTLIRYDSLGADVPVEHIEYCHEYGDPDEFGCLLEVKKYTKNDLDAASAVPGTLDENTIYRYDDPEGNGFPRLVAVFGTEAIENYLAALNAVNQTVFTLDQAADRLRDRDITTADDHMNNGTLYQDFADKIVEYEAYADALYSFTGDHDERVSTQYIRRGCTCSSDGSLKREYSRFEGTGPSSTNTVATSTISSVVREYIMDGSWILHRTYVRSYERIHGSRMVHAKIMHSAIIDSAGNAWVTSYDYPDLGLWAITDMTAGARKPYRVNMPSAHTASYTIPDDTDIDGSFQLKSSGGLSRLYAYRDDGRMRAEYVSNDHSAMTVGLGLLDTSDLSALQSVHLVRTYCYNDTKNDLLEAVNSVRIYDQAIVPAPGCTVGSVADIDLETTGYDYGYFGSIDDSALAWVETTAEAEEIAENGPGGTYKSYELYTEEGLNIVSRAADGALTVRTFDALTGSQLTVTRNASSSLLPASPHAGLDVSNWGDRNADGGALITRYTYDANNRLIEMEGPGGVKSYTLRVTKGLTSDPSTVLDAVVTLPHIIDGANSEYSGPARITWTDLSGRTVQSSTFSMPMYSGGEPAYRSHFLGTGPSPLDDFDSTTELSRAVMVYDDAGRVVSDKSWYDVSEALAFDETTYTYDKLGRVESVTNPNGTDLPP